MKLPKKLEEKVKASIAELEQLAVTADFDGQIEDAEAYRKVALNLKRSEWAAAYRNAWQMDTYPREGISHFTFNLMEMLGT